MKIQLKTINSLIDNVKTFVFKPLQPAVWKAGQYIHITLPHAEPDDRGQERWFTISSAPFEEDVWITTRWFKDDASSFKKALNDLSEGETIEVDEPDGDFIEANPEKNYIFVAGGIGITPFRSILNQLDFEERPIRTELLYANRDENSIIFKDELEALSQKHEDFNITYFNGDNKIDEAVLSDFGKKLEDPYYYISGPEPMVEAIKKSLEVMGVAESRIKLDYFPGYSEV